MKEMGEAPRVFAPDTQSGPETLSQGFIPVTYDQCERAFEVVKNDGGHVSLHAIASKIEGSPRPFDILEAMCDPTQTEKFCNLFSEKIKTVRHILTIYKEYREELARIAAREDKSSTYENVAARLGKGLHTIIHYFHIQYPGLIESFGITLKYASGKIRTTRGTRAHRNIVRRETGELLVGAESDKFEQLGTIIRNLYHNRSSIASGVPIEDIARDLFIRREGAREPVNEEYIKALFIRMRNGNRTLYDELVPLVIGL